MLLFFHTLHIFYYYAKFVVMKVTIVQIVTSIH